MGELGGRGLIKNAINEALVAVESIAESIAKDLAKLSGRGDDPDVLDVVIVGAGPTGLSAGLTAAPSCRSRWSSVMLGRNWLYLVSVDRNEDDDSGSWQVYTALSWRF